MSSFIPDMWILKLLVKIKPIIILILFLVFLLIFGLPSYSSYTNYDTFVKSSKLEAEPLASPALTICVEPVREI